MNFLIKSDTLTDEMLSLYEPGTVDELYSQLAKDGADTDTIAGSFLFKNEAHHRDLFEMVVRFSAIHNAPSPFEGARLREIANMIAPWGYTTELVGQVDPYLLIIDRFGHPLYAVYEEKPSDDNTSGICPIDLTMAALVLSELIRAKKNGTDEESTMFMSTCLKLVEMPAIGGEYYMTTTYHVVVFGPKVEGDAIEE